MLKQYFYRIWHSPTLMTWGSFLAKSLNLIAVLPLLLTRLSTVEISLWYLFVTIIGLQMLLDIGFSPTFSRVVAYAMGGAEIEDLKNPKTQKHREPNWNTMKEVCSTMRYVFLRLNILWTISLVVLGTMAMLRPISQLENRLSAWLAWGIIVITSAVSFRNNIYSSYLQGVNQIALLRRWEMFFSIGSILTSFLVLLLNGDLLLLVFTNRGWRVLNMLRNRWLARTVEQGRFRGYSKSYKNTCVFEAVWPSAWRSGLGILMTYGLIQSSGIIYAQVESAAGVASYLLALNLIRNISLFSQAPFYSKLPLMARLYSVGKKGELIRVAKKGMALSHWTYVAGFLCLGLIGKSLLMVIHSNVGFPACTLWIIMGLAFFVERYGAMHIQLYSTTNNIIWHVANGVSGVIFLVVSVVLFQVIGVYAFPVGILSGYAGFYAWYSAMHAYREFDLSFLSFEMSTSFGPLVVILAYSASTAFFR